jgi:hypothetical protein
MAGIGEQPERSDEHLDAGFLDGLPDGGFLGGLSDVDATSRQLPGPAVTPADQEQPTVEPPRRDEDRRHDIVAVGAAGSWKKICRGTAARSIVVMAWPAREWG